MASQGTEWAGGAVFLDGMGTLLRLVPPTPPLTPDAFRREAEYYVAHHLEGRDAASVADLRRRCADLAGVSVEVLMGALRFEAFEDAQPALEDLRRLGLQLVVVSNWDASLPGTLESVGLLRLVDHVVCSAAVGAAKPDRRVFDAALERAGRRPGEVLHVGDSLENDVRGAEGAGIRALLLDRSGARGAGTIGSLAELPALLS
jgi:putative hydrolase of the HAD superfamily